MNSSLTRHRLQLAGLKRALQSRRDRLRTRGAPDGLYAFEQALLDLRSPDIERYSFLIAHTLQECGLRLQLRPCFEALGKLGNPYQRWILSMPGLKLNLGPHFAKRRTLYLTDSDSRTLRDRRWRAAIKVNYDWFSTPAGSLAMPYWMHPMQYEAGHHQRLPSLRASPKRLGTLFAGNFDPVRYSHGAIADVFSLMPRARIKDIVDKRPRDSRVCRLDAARVVGGKADLQALLESPSFPGDEARRFTCVPSNARIKAVDWMSALSQSDFLLAAPGVNIPLSHNIVEALAVGCIPITNYGHLMKPTLTGREALLFQTEDELLHCLQRAADMPFEERRRMSEAGARYYDRNLSEASFKTKFWDALRNRTDAPVELFINAEHPTLAALSERGVRLALPDLVRIES